MNVNDAICVGAEPIAFVDYIAVREPDEEMMRQLGAGLNKGAELANISIIGGETASIGEIVNGLDLAGTCLAIVKKTRVITGKRISEGDAIIGLRSSGIHSNGYSLVRNILNTYKVDYNLKFPDSERSWGEILLEPTAIYVTPVLDLVKKLDVNGLANITGGGMRNISRLNSGFGFRIDHPPDPQPVFKALQRLGDLDLREMYQTFNMGIGFVAVVDDFDVDEALAIMSTHGLEAWRIGTVVKGKGVEVVPFGLKYE